MRFQTFGDLTNTIYKNIHKIPTNIDLVVGIPRSGLIPAEMIALFRNTPFCDLESFVSNRPLKTGVTRIRKDWITEPFVADRILVVDDSISMGHAIKEAKSQIFDSGYQGIVNYCAIYADPTAICKIDIYFEIVSQPRLFEWNYLHHWALEFACMDIDGVLCNDPKYIQNDDGEQYKKFIANAEPRFIPTKPVYALVTTRLEKYRVQTETWLKKQEVEYSHLIMLDGVTAQERALSGTHGQFKGDYYKSAKKTALFIESNYEQAVQICKIAQKQVFCTENRKLITPDNVSAHLQIVASDLKLTLKHIVKKFLGGKSK